jgi:hypothetical protein
MFKVSDFKLPTAFIKKACYSSHCVFVDLPVVFEYADENHRHPMYHNGELYIGETELLGDTLSRIITAYLLNFKEITGENIPCCEDLMQRTIIYVNNFFRFLCFYQDSFSEAKDDAANALRLYQKPFVWLIMKDILAPAFDEIVAKNCKIVEGHSNCVDAALFVSEEEYSRYDDSAGVLDEPFVFVNTDIEYEPYSAAHLLVEAIKCEGECPVSIMEKVFTSSLYDKLVGLTKLAFKSDKEVNDFFLCLMTICGFDNQSHLFIQEAVDEHVKTAQATGQHGGNQYQDISDTWWFLGLIEKMLEPARGPDWSTHKRLQPFLEKLWNKINKERKKRGRDGLTYEALLRIKDGEIDPDKVFILERELDSNRTW